MSQRRHSRERMSRQNSRTSDGGSKQSPVERKSSKGGHEPQYDGSSRRSSRASQIIRRISQFFERSESIDPTMMVTPLMIERCRQRFLRRVQAYPDDYDESDVELVKENDFTVKRYLEYQLSQGADEEAGLEQLDEAMRWRHSYGVNKRSFKDCPREFFESGALFWYYWDKKGKIFFWITVLFNELLL